MENPWFETLPLAEFDEDKSLLMTQLRATKWSATMQFHRQVRTPLNVHDLFNGTKNNQIIWMDATSFISFKKLPKSVPYGSKFRKAAADIKFSSKSVYIYGLSNDIVALTAARFLCLEDEKTERVHIGDHCKNSDPLVPTAFITSEFLHKYHQANPSRQLVLWEGCHLSKEQSIALASHHEPLNVGLHCMFDDWGQQFVNTLSKRTSFFGKLSIHYCSNGRMTSKYLSFENILRVVNEVPLISLNTTSSIFKDSQCLLPLSSPAQRVEYIVSHRMGYHDTPSFTTIVTRAIKLIFDCSLPSQFHTLFLQASGNLREMGLIYDDLHEPSPVQQAELLKAIQTNVNLIQLELGCVSFLDAIWSELLLTIESHRTLQTVIFWLTGDRFQNQIRSLEGFMKTHYIHLNVLFKYHHLGGRLEGEWKAAVEPLRLLNGLRALARESMQARPALLGAALTRWASSNFGRSSQLLIENVDILCSLVAHPPSSDTRRRRPLDDDPEIIEPRASRSRLG